MDATVPGGPPAAGPSGGEGQMTTTTQLISHGRGQFPPLELFSIPRRQPSGRARNQREPSNTTTNTTEPSRVRITRRLSDVRVLPYSHVAVSDKSFILDGFQRCFCWAKG